MKPVRKIYYIIFLTGYLFTTPKPASIFIQNIDSNILSKIFFKKKQQTNSILTIKYSQKIFSAFGVLLLSLSKLKIGYKQ